MKKYIVMLVILCMLFTLFALTGCGQSSDQPAAPADDKATDDAADTLGEQYTIATVVKLIGIGWFDRMEVGIEKFGEDTGHTTFLLGPPHADAALQVQIIEDLIAQQVDAICVVPYSPEALEPVLQKARDMGIVVISHEADNQESVDFDIEAFDNEAYGAFLMDNLAEYMDYEGEYITMVGNVTNTSHMQWEKGGVERQLEKYPNMTAIERQIETMDEQKNAYDRMREALAAYPNLKGVLGGSSQDAPGAALAVEEAGLIDQMSIVGTSLVSISSKYLESGALDMIAFWDPADAGIAMNKLAVMVLDGRKDEITDGFDLGVPGYDNILIKNDKYLYGTAQVSVTKENMNDFDF